MKQAWKSLMVAGAMMFSLTGSALAATPATLTDIGNSYAKDQINKLYNAGIVSGDENYHFNPAGNMTRSQLAVLLTKSLGLTPDATASATFTDVADWARPYVGALVKAGLASGYDAKTFGGNDPVTREQLAVFFVRAFDATDLSKQLNLSNTTFTDDSNISAYAKPYVALMQKLSFINGYSTTDGMEFNPTGHADRQAVAHLVSEFYFDKDTYAQKLDGMKTVDQILKQTVDAMKTINSVSVSYNSNLAGQDLNDPAQNMTVAETAALDLTLSPLSSHGTIHGNAVFGGQTSPLDTEIYLNNGTLYYKDDQGTWHKTNAGISTKDITDGFAGDPNGYHQMAADFKLTDSNADTYTLTATQNASDQGITDPTIQDKMSYTIVIDKNTQWVKSFTVNDKMQTFTDLVVVMLTNYNTVQPVTVPQDIQDTAIVDPDPTQDPTQGQTQVPTQALQQLMQFMN